MVTVRPEPPEDFDEITEVDCQYYQDTKNTKYSLNFIFPPAFRAFREETF